MPTPAPEPRPSPRGRGGEKTSYKETIRLPKTPFSMKANLQELEPSLLKRWEEAGLYRQIRAARAGATKYVLHDGPPYASGEIHIGTGMNKLLKDIVVKQKTMSGLDVPFIPGWDCHGQPIERKVVEEIGPANAKQTPKLEIRRRSHAFAVKHLEGGNRQFRALGVLGRWERCYLTLDPAYEAGVVDVFRDLVKGGYAYRKRRPVHWCAVDETALAEAEIEYEEREDPSVYLRFALREGTPSPQPSPGGRGSGGEGLLVWTTTPWTLFGNVAVAVAGDADYDLVEYARSGKREASFVASALREKVLAKIGATDARVLDTRKGQALEGLRYERPFAAPAIEREASVVTAPYVSLEDGTGLVHTAPGHGREDYETSLRYGLPVVSPVDEEGKLTAEVPETFRGQWVLKANDAIVAHLGERSVLVAKEKVRHSYPHCWRCHKPVIFRATAQWFIGVDHERLRERALEAIRSKVQWVPAYGQARIEGMLAERPDWCISRQRAWGIPIPAFYCAAEGCGEPLLTVESVTRVRDVFAKEGTDAWYGKTAAEILGPGFTCSKCGGAAFTKRDDIFDVWFESGTSFCAVVENEPELSFPSDLYLEGSDQHRGWFQLSLLPAMAARGTPPFKTVVTHGFIVDEKGEKFSKSKGNYISLEDGLKRFSADILRLFFSSVEYWDDIPVSPARIEGMRDVYRKIRNTFKYLLGNLDDFPGGEPGPGGTRGVSPLETGGEPGTGAGAAGVELDTMDRWVLHELEALRAEVTKAYAEFRFHRVYRLVHDFCVVEMSAIYFEAARDRLYCELADAPRRRGTQQVLYRVLSTLTRLLAPILVYTTEEVWDHVRALGGAPKDLPASVHLAPWPEARGEAQDQELATRMARLIELRDAVYREIERLRKGGEVGEPTEVEMELALGVWAGDTASGPGAELVEAVRWFGEERLAELLVVAGVRVTAQCTGDPKVALPGLVFAVKPSGEPKCERCRVRRPRSSDAAHPDVCERCARVLAELSPSPPGRGSGPTER